MVSWDAALYDFRPFEEGLNAQVYQKFKALCVTLRVPGPGLAKLR